MDVNARFSMLLVLFIPISYVLCRPNGVSIANSVLSEETDSDHEVESQKLEGSPNKRISNIPRYHQDNVSQRNYSPVTRLNRMVTKRRPSSHTRGKKKRCRNGLPTERHIKHTEIDDSSSPNECDDSSNLKGHVGAHKRLSKEHATEKVRYKKSKDRKSESSGFTGVTAKKYTPESEYSLSRITRDIPKCTPYMIMGFVVALIVVLCVFCLCRLPRCSKTCADCKSKSESEAAEADKNSQTKEEQSNGNGKEKEKEKEDGDKVGCCSALMNSFRNLFKGKKKNGKDTCTDKCVCPPREEPTGDSQPESGESQCEYEEESEPESEPDSQPVCN